MKELKARKFAPFPKEKEERIRTLEKAHAEVVEKIKASEAEEAQRRNKEERGFVYFSRGNAGADKARELSAEDGRRVADALSGFIEGVNVEVLDDAAFEARLREAKGVNAFAGSEYDGEAEIEVVNIDSPLNSDEQKDTSRIKNEILKPLIGSEVEIRSDGRIVQFTRTGIESALKKRNLHRSVLNDLTRVVSGSRYFDYVEGDGQEKHKDVLGQFVYAVPMRIGEAIYRCEIKIDRLTSNGPGEGSFKQQSVFKIADVALSTGITRQGRSEAEASSTTSVKVKMRELMGEVNPKNVRVPFQRIFGDEQEIGSAGSVERRYSRVSSNAKDAEYLEPSDFGEDGRVKPEILAEIEAEKAKIREDAQKNGSFMKAPNGAPSKLNADQWVLVRTKRFKRWFGDWEFARQIEQIFKMSPIHSLTGTEFQKDGVPLTEKVTAFWKEKHNGVAVNPTLGTVRLDREGVKDSLGHGIGSLKSAAYAAVPSVIEHGIIFDRQTNWKNRGYDTAVLAAPITIGDKEYICEVIVETRPNRQGFYLHEVELKEKAENAFKTPTKGSAFPTSRLILAKKAYKVNEEGVSKVVDENGEPRVVYHGTNERRIEFDSDFLGSATQGVGTQYGFFFSPSLKRAEFYARHSVRGENVGVVEACFLDIKKPTTREPANDGGLSYEEELDDAAGNHYATGIDGVILKNQIDDDTFEPADNYLVFDSTQIKSATENAGTYSRGKTEIRLLRDFASKVYGWYEPKTKRVVLRAGARMDTALHEILGHATFDWARGNAPELYAKMREYAAGAPEEVKAAIRDAYPDVAEGSAAWEDEVFAHLIAADNEDLIRSRVLGEAGVSWLGKVRAWFGRLWRRFVRALGGSASEDLDVRSIAGMDAKAGMRRLVESALAGKRLGTWSAEARERGNAVSPERERFYSRAAEGTRRARAETASKLNEELEAWKNRYAELLSFGGMALSADARDANYERARLERAKGAESRRRAVASEAQRATAKHSGDGLDETTAKQMRESRIPLLGSAEGGDIVGWAKRVCEAVKARYGLEGDAAESDEFVCICVKGKNFGDFTIADAPYEEFEARRKAINQRLALRSPRDVAGLVSAYRDGFRRDNGGASRSENGGAGLGDGGGNDRVLRQDGKTAESQSSDDGDGVYTPDGRLFARRVRDGRRNSVVRDGGEVNTENTEERRNRESPAFKSATGNAGTYAPENPDIRYSVLRKRGKWDNWRVVDMQELAELNINYGTLRDGEAED